MIDTIDFKEVEVWILEAGQLALQEAKKNLPFQFKEDHTVVTDADREIEKFLVSKIRARYPYHEIISEEGTRHSGSTYSWVVDPIDGTLAFIWGIPTWSISIGLLRNMKPYFGLILVPSTGDLYSGLVGGEALFNGKPIKVASPRDLDSSSVLCISPRTLQQFHLNFPGNIVSLVSGIFQHSLVARGAATGSLTLKPNIWDLAGVLPILLAAGGSAKYIDGKDVDLEALSHRASSEPILLCHPDIFSKLCGTLLQEK